VDMSRPRCLLRGGVRGRGPLAEMTPFQLIQIIGALLNMDAFALSRRDPLRAREGVDVNAPHALHRAGEPASDAGLKR